MQHCEITLSQMQFHFPPITNSISQKKLAFFLLSSHKPHRFWGFYKVGRY